jgi:hypothetical protein
MYLKEIVKGQSPDAEERSNWHAMAEGDKEAKKRMAEATLRLS